MDAPLLALLILGTFLIAYFVAAIGPTGGLQLALTSATTPSSAVIPLHAWISAMSATFRAVALRDSIDRAFVLRFALPSLAATGGAVAIGSALGYDWIKILIGAYISLDALGLLNRLERALKLERLSAPEAAGFMTGFVTAFIGASGPLLWSLMRDRFEDRLRLSGTHSACLVIQHTSKILLFGLIGLSVLECWPALLGTLVASALGTYFGQTQLRRVDEETYRRLLDAALFLSGVYIVFLGVQSLSTSGG